MSRTFPRALVIDAVACSDGLIVDGKSDRVSSSAFIAVTKSFGKRGTDRPVLSGKEEVVNLTADQNVVALPFPAT